MLIFNVVPWNHLFYLSWGIAMSCCPLKLCQPHRPDPSSVVVGGRAEKPCTQAAQQVEIT